MEQLHFENSILLDKCYYKTQPDLSNLQTTCLVLANNMINIIHDDFLPANLTMVDFSKNYIHEDGLPFTWQRTLEYIYLQHNCILHLDNQNWPQNLKLLNISQNPLQTFPNNLPEELIKLMLDETNIETISENLPRNCIWFSARRGYLQKLPKSLPEGIVTLLLNENFLASKYLPTQWGNSLKVLDLENNKLKEFPKNLPSSLEILRLSRNKITHIPANLPESLNQLNIAYNRVRTIECKSRKKPIEFVFINENQLTFSIQDIQHTQGIRWAFSILEEDNWTKSYHKEAATKIQKAWRKNRFRKIIKTWKNLHQYREELLAAAMHPSRAGRFEDISTEWPHWGC